MDKNVWVSIVKDIKKQIAEKRKGYVLGGNVMDLSSNGFTIKIRTDCSGFVSACVSCLLKKNVTFSTSSQISILSKLGFKVENFKSWDELKEGDILHRNGHTEIFSHNKGRSHYVWNCGSFLTCNNPKATLTILKPLHVIRLPQNNKGTSNIKKENKEKGETKVNTKSSLVNVVKISPNKTSPRNASVNTITPHCVVGQLTAERLGNVFQNTSRQASSNYGIGSDGKIGLYVDEKDRSWCTSSPYNDNRAITIECASDLKEPYEMTELVYNKLIDLCVDICKRYNKRKMIWLGSKEKQLAYKPKPDEMMISAHRWYANKSCLPINGTELLTKQGWVSLKNISVGDEIATIDTDFGIMFDKIYDKVDTRRENVYKLNSGYMATSDHRTLFKERLSREKWHIRELRDLVKKGFIYIPGSGQYNGKGIPLADEEIKLLIVIQLFSNFSTVKKNNELVSVLNFEIREIEKIIKFRKLLRKNNLIFKEKRKSKEFSQFIVEYDNKIEKLCLEYLEFNKFKWNLLEMRRSQAIIFLKEFLYWKGSIEVKFLSSTKDNIEFISALCAINFIESTSTDKSIQLRTKPWRSEVKGSIMEDEEVSCVSVRTGLILIKQNGRTFVTGNCPGNWLYSRYGDLVNKVNARLAGSVIDNNSNNEEPLYKKDEIVIFKGNTHYRSINAETGSVCRPGKARVNTIHMNGKHQYHLIGIEGEGGSGVYGWVDAKDISKLIKEDKDNSFIPYRVNIKTKYLTIRKGPGVNYMSTGKYTGLGIVTIVDEKIGPNGIDGQVGKWGLLKAYSDNKNGWILLDKLFVEKI